MRQTVLTGDGGQRLTVVTDDQGTEVLDAEGRVVRMYSTDRHEEQVAAQQGEGWRVAEDTHAAPEPVAGEPPAGPGPSGDARDPQSLVNDGEDA